MLDSARSSSLLPVAWLPAKVSSCEDEHSILFSAINERVWKAAHQKTAEATTELVATIGEPAGVVSRGLDCGDELKTQIRRLILVVACSGKKLIFRCGVELERCHRCVDRAFAKTRSAGVACASPDSSSCSRRSASSCQAASASGSTCASKLEMSRSAKRARSLLGSCRARDSRSRAEPFMSRG
jgi:hypothetical protein